MSVEDLPSNFLLFNDQLVKNLSVVVEIEGLDLLGSTPVYTRLRYGDPGIFYGMPGIVYGGLRPVPGSRDLLSLGEGGGGGGLTISQRIEPEQGRGSVSTLSLNFIDKDGYMTMAIADGVLLDTILNKEVKVWLGFQEISFPEDFFIIFRGRISGVENQTGSVTLQTSDPNIIRRQQLFFAGKTKLSASVTDVQTVIPVISATDFHTQETNPFNVFDPAIKTYIKIENEYIQYPPAFASNAFSSVIRGATLPVPTSAGTPTVAAAHAIGSDVEAILVIEDHAIDMALKLMLSGWGGPYLENVPIYSFVKTSDPVLGDIPGTIILPPKKDADRDYGLYPGDYLTVTGASNPANNGIFIVQSFQDFNDDKNRIIHTNGAHVSEYPTSAVMSLRSQFDVYPKTAGLRMSPTEVDVAGHLALKDLFLGGSENRLRFLLSSAESSGKTFIENEIYLPIVCYSLTRQGRMSIGLTKPPLADEKLKVLDKNNILNPNSIKPSRGLNNRKFFNDIQFEYDADVDGRFTNISRTLSGDSFSKIKTTSLLPIRSRGGRTDLGFEQGILRRTSFLLSRYQYGAIMLDVKVNWGTGVQIEAGDVVAVKDNGDLQIGNFATGARDLGTQLFEVIDRTFDIKQGVSLKLLSGVGADITDRYATVAPSSLVSTGSTTSQIKIQDSFGAIYPGNEKKKWKDYIGLNILVHNATWTVSGVTTLTGFVPGDDYMMTVSPALGFTPTAGYIVDLDNYSTSTDPTDQSLAKQVHVFLDPTVTVVSGISTTSFTVGGGDVSKFRNGFPLVIHNTNFSILSPEVKVQSIVGTTITVDASLGFTPAAGQKVELLGFADGGGPYRRI